jgi:phage tail-like protein
MKSPSTPPAEFYFELSANEEQTPFQSIEGVSTEVALKNILQAGENPFKYRLPSLPKTGNLILKHGHSKRNSKLIQWCNDNQNREESAAPSKARVALHLKDAKGKSLLEWTLFNAYPGKINLSQSRSKGKETEIEGLELAYSFFTLSKK